jgi:uncharacterized membrane-anchored protein YjiN (DUF445 family)
VTASSPPVAPVPSAVPFVADEAARTRELLAMKRRATGLLAVVAAVFAIVLVVGDGEGLDGVLLAAAEGGMVGGLADWFAVTALFRHPLGIPIPHTAVVRERKDQFAGTLGGFVQQHFLNAEVVAERLRAARPAERAAGWLAGPAGAERAGHAAAEVLVAVTGALRDGRASAVAEQELGRALLGAPLAPLTGRALRAALDRGRHQRVLDSVLVEVRRYVLEHGDELRDRLGHGGPWWLPGVVEDRVARRVLEATVQLVDEVLADAGHEIRALVDRRLHALADRLEHDPALAARAHQLVADVLADPQVHRGWAELWQHLDDRVRAAAADPASPLRVRLAEAAAAAGRRLQRDAALRERLDAAIVDAARTAVERNGPELADLVTGTMARWDADETSDRLELLLGRDLQFIRINGTVVGALAGTLIHLVAVAAG